MNSSTVRGIVKNAPNGVIIICGTILAISVLGAYVFLANSGKDAAEISRFVNTLLNFAMILVGSVGAVAAGAAAKSAGEAKDVATEAKDEAATAAKQTNGGLTARLDAIETAINQRNDEPNPDQGRLL